jgi:fructoselysine-6-P-deglycase FrlB-like protein
MSYVAAEIASQPDTWAAAAELARTREATTALPESGARVAIVGCGTSFFMAQAAAALRESCGHGETDAFPASEFPTHRRYDRIVAITRSGTTTEVIELLRRLPERNSTVITTAATHPVAGHASATVVLDFADERSVVQTRFATATLALWRSHLGQDLTGAIAEARDQLAHEIDGALLERARFTFLGSGWTVGLASEAALKLRETAQSWTEAYPAMEFRHGPISVVDERSVVWIFGPVPAGLAAEIARTGAAVVDSARDPMAQLIGAQRLAVAIAERKGLDPDAPRHLTRSIVLGALGAL